MAIKIKCRKCEAKFSVKDAAAGRRVKCRECGAPIKVPVPKTEEEELLDFDTAAYGDDPSGDEPPGNEPSGGTQPLPRRRKKKTTGSESGSGRKWNLENPLLWFVVPVTSAVLVYVTTMFDLRLGGGITKLIVAVAWLVAFICWWKILALAFDESGLAGLLCLLVPFYILYFVATEWHAAKKMFLVQVVAGLTLTSCYQSFHEASSVWFVHAISTIEQMQEQQMQERIEAQAEADAAP